VRVAIVVIAVGAVLRLIVGGTAAGVDTEAIGRRRYLERTSCREFPGDGSAQAW
jgi:hypothetical protein